MNGATILSGIEIGIGGTIAIDLWNGVIRRAFGIHSLNYCMLGRWVHHMRFGVMRHANIGSARAMPFECATGWGAHYSIGAGLGALFASVAGAQWFAQPTFVPALVFGVATVVFPFFVMQPALGLGIASAATPRPAAARVKSLITHAMYGLGMFAAACLMNG